MDETLRYFRAIDELTAGMSPAQRAEFLRPEPDDADDEGARDDRH